MQQTTRNLCLALAAALLAGHAAAQERRPYKPWIDLEAPLEDGQPVVWRGDQRHANRLPGREGEPAHVYRIRNFRWNFVLETEGEHRDHWAPVFGEAVVDTTRITGMSLLLYPFAPEILAGHTSLLIHLEPGALRPGEGLAKRDDLGPSPVGIVVSLEAFMKQGEKYGFKDGILGNFGTVYCVSTGANYVQRCVDVYQGELHRWPLSISRSEAVVYGRAALDRALADHRGETYWLTRNSCATAVMDILIEGVQRFQRIRHSAAREADLEALVRANENTREVDTDSLLGAFGRWMLQQARETVTLTRTRKLLGLHRDRVARESPFGIFVNPFMSFPAQIPGVLRRRGLIAQDEPAEVFEFRPAVEEAEEPGFGGLTGS